MNVECRRKEFYRFYFSDRINRIEKYESKINPDNPVNPGQKNGQSKTK